MPATHCAVGAPVHEREHKAIQFVVRKLPSHYLVYSNLELTRSAGSAQSFEHDLVVVGPHGVFTVEIKSWGGRITGNRDLWTLDDGTLVNSPLPLISAKARALKGSLSRAGKFMQRVWVQHLVFLSAADAKPRITEDFRALVTTRQDVITALTDPSWLPQHRLYQLSPGEIRRIGLQLGDGRAPGPRQHIGKYRLVEQLPAEDRPFDIWIGQDDLNERRILHIYDIDAPSKKERDRLKQRAMREATRHNQLYAAPDILRYYDYLTDPEPCLRIALAFEDTTGLISVDTWVSEHKPTHEQRLRVAERMAKAVAWVHERGLVHRDISPEAFRVSNEPDPQDLRLCAFELARERANLTVTQTYTGSSLSQSRAVAPEFHRMGQAKEPADVFSLAALLYHLFTGRPLFANADDVLRHSKLDRAPLYEAGLGGQLVDVLANMLAPRPQDRPQNGAQALADALAQCLDGSSRSTPTTLLAVGETLRQNYELLQYLGRGATGQIWKAKHIHLGHDVALKIANTDHVSVLQREAEVLREVRHPNLVGLINVEPLADGNMLVLDLAPGVTGSEWAELGDGLSSRQLLRLAEGLFSALDALHGSGWLHRDIKPANLLLTEPDAKPTVLDLGLATTVGTEGNLAVGSVAYKDPLLFAEGQWTPANDLYAAWVSLFEILTGIHPFGSAAPDPDNAPAIDDEMLPDSVELPVRQSLLKLFLKALSPKRRGRPKSAPEALQHLSAALQPPETAAVRVEQPAKTSQPSALLPANAEPQTPVETLRLSVRAHGALDRLGVVYVADLLPIEPEGLRRLKNVGAKTAAELRQLVLEARERFSGAPLPAKAQQASSQPLPFYPALVESDQPITELGKVISQRLRTVMAARGILTVGDLAAYPAQAVSKLRGIGQAKLEQLKKAMDSLSGTQAANYDTLEAVAGAIAEECTESNYEYLSFALGLVDGQAHDTRQLIEHFSITRQRVHQALNLSHFQAQASAGHWLAEQITSALPAHGFASLSDIAAVLEARLPSTTDELSHLGFARLGAWIALGAKYVSSRLSVDPMYTTDPWQTGEVSTLALRLLVATTSAQNDPESPSLLLAKDLEQQLWQGLSLSHQEWLNQQEVDPTTLLAALRKLSPEVQRNGLGHLYIAPVPWRQALTWLRPHLNPPTADWANLRQQALSHFSAVDLPETLDSQVLEHLQRSGYRVEGTGENQTVVDADRVQKAQPVQAVELDAIIPKARLDQPPEPWVDRPSPTPGAQIPTALRGLVSAALVGGFRVVMLPPGEHHRLSRELATRLSTILGQDRGQDRVHYLDLDALLMQLMHTHDLWEDALFFETDPNPSWGWAHDELTQGLDAYIDAHSGRGKVLVLGEPSLLGPLDLMSWLTGFYDRARGGEHGLIILAAPGGLRDERVRLNGQYHMPYTPDMAAVYLEEA